jgi:hypothetical protein
MKLKLQRRGGGLDEKMEYKLIGFRFQNRTEVETLDKILKFWTRLGCKTVKIAREND